MRSILPAPTMPNDPDPIVRFASRFPLPLVKLVVLGGWCALTYMFVCRALD